MMIPASLTQCSTEATFGVFCSLAHLEVTSIRPKRELQHIAIRAIKFYGLKAQVARQAPKFLPDESLLQFRGGSRSWTV